jgi:hypothetical protein
VPVSPCRGENSGPRPVLPAATDELGRGWWCLRPGSRLRGCSPAERARPLVPRPLHVHVREATPAIVLTDSRKLWLHVEWKVD